MSTVRSAGATALDTKRPTNAPRQELRARYGVQHRMKAIIGLFLPFALLAAGAAGPTIVGSWDCVGTDAGQRETYWTLRVDDAAGKLSVSLQSKDSGDSLQGLNPKLEGSRLTFNIRINETELVELALNFDGDRLDGRFAGKDSGAGVLKGTRPANVSGAWSGDWEVGPDGGPGPHYMILKQDGANVTGTAGPTADMQMAIQNGKFANGTLTFEISIPEGPMLRFEFKPAGDNMPGTAVLIMNGTEHKLKLAAKRVSQ
jgi:hypothetical protein